MGSNARGIPPKRPPAIRHACAATHPACQTLLHFNNTGAAQMHTPAFSVQNGFPDAKRMMGGHEAEAAQAQQPDPFQTGLAA